jgi:hypothetical protein
MNKWKIRDCWLCDSCSWRGVLDTTLCEKVCQWLATRRWFSLGTPVSSTNKTDCHNITEILLKVALITINNPCFQHLLFIIDVLHSVCLTIRDMTSDVICEYILLCILSLLHSNNVKQCLINVIFLIHVNIYIQCGQSENTISFQRRRNYSFFNW